LHNNDCPPVLFELSSRGTAEINMMEGHSFWPIVQRIKEGRSLKNDSVNNSNVTEGVPSLPPLESKVTAYQPKSKVTTCNAMRAPHSARNNIKEGGSVNSNVTEGVPSLPPVESKVTAYQPKSKVMARNAMRAPRSARNNIKKEGFILEVPMDDEDDYFSKECHIGANRIESYVTEQLPMDNNDDYFSKECRVGANRIKSYVAEQLPMDDEDDYFSNECGIGANRIESYLTE
jgi:hypothetical protein